jgi:16S rRNA (uracil1498-N3)-methyltransferase
MREETGLSSMSNIRLFVSQPLFMGAVINMEADHLHYLYHVMRAASGDSVSLFNGHDGEWLGTISSINKRLCTISIMKQEKSQFNEPSLTLAFAPTKTTVSFVVQKATELGVTKIVPVLMKHSVVKSVNHQKLQAVAIDAAEQSGRLCVPVVYDIVTLEVFLGNRVFSGMLFYCDERQANNTPLYDAKEWDDCILIGPEGGLAAEDRAILENMPKTCGISLGRRILRADTAAVTALSLYQFLDKNYTTL